MLCLVRSIGCPVFEVNVKIKILVPSDVINRSKSIDFNTKCLRLLVLLEASTRFDDVTKNQPSNNLISLLSSAFEVVSYLLILVHLESIEVCNLFAKLLKMPLEGI